MAQKYSYMEGKYHGWRMEICEERLLIACFHQIEGRIRPGERWPVEFHQYFYVSGLNTGEDRLTQLNRERRRCSLGLFVVSETTVFDYGRTSDRSWKAKARQEMREEYLSLTEDLRTEWIATAQAEIAELPEPSMTFEQVSQQRGHLSEEERGRRRHAVRCAQPSEAPAPIARFERAIRVMNLTTDDTTIDLIMRSITPDEALLIAETQLVRNPTIVDRLIERSLDPITDAALETSVELYPPRPARQLRVVG